MRVLGGLRIAAVVALIGVSGCSDLVGPSRSDFTVNRQRWEAAGYVAYSFTYRQSCFCTVTEPLKVYVSNGQVLDVRRVSDNSKVDPNVVYSIEALFDFIARGQQAHAVLLNVKYDRTLGYPTEINFDGSTSVADDEVTFTVSDVQRLGLIN